jgi:hypothetical protein
LGFSSTVNASLPTYLKQLVGWQMVDIRAPEFWFVASILKYPVNFVPDEPLQCEQSAVQLSL